MIDIHTHILPMVDDGFQSVNESLLMLERAYQDGTDEMVLTPHLAYPYDFINPYRKIKELFNEFQEIVQDEGIPIKLYLGCEFLFTSTASFYKHLEDITRINQTQYLLMEFFFDVQEDLVLEAIDTVIENHYIPIIAHPERYECMQASRKLPLQCIEKGALLQMNRGSLFGQYGTFAKECIHYLLENHYISFIGSDAHTLNRRHALMYEDYCYIEDHYGHEYVRDIFKNNPAKMLENKDIRGLTK